jgi:hypothetical protein
MTFDGEKTRIVGDIGVSPSTAIAGNYAIAPGGQVHVDSASFAASVLDAHSVAMLVPGTAMAIEIGGLTFTPGTCRSGSAINFAAGTVVTLDGMNEANPVFLFIAGSTLVTAANTYFILTNGAKAANIVWALGSAATLGADSVLEGSILAGTAITFGTKSEMRGCALAQSAVTFASRGHVNVRKQSDSSPCPGDAAGAGVCENYAVHARATITSAGAPNTQISNGDISVSPGTSITGNCEFDTGSTIVDSAAFATSVMFDHADLRSRRSVETHWGVVAHEIGGATFYPGTCRAGTAINIALGAKVTLDGLGDDNSVFLFQAGTTFVTAADTCFELINGANAKNIVWALGTAATLGARSVVQGSILDGTAIAFGTKSKVHGCAIAMTAVTFETEGCVIVP